MEFGNRFVSTPGLSERGGGGEALPGEAAGRKPHRRPRVPVPAHPPSGAPRAAPLSGSAVPPAPKPGCPLLGVTARRRPWGGGGSSGRGAEQSPPAAAPADRFRVSAGSVGGGLRAGSVPGCVVQAGTSTRSGTARRAWSRNLFWPLGRALNSRSLPPRPSRFAEKTC